jgi:hypothetical protein
MFKEAMPSDEGRYCKRLLSLPIIEDCLDSLQGMTTFCTLDLASGYYQIQLEDCDRKKTAFITRHGLFEHTRMGMGLISFLNNFLGLSFKLNWRNRNRAFLRLVKQCSKDLPRMPVPTNRKELMSFLGFVNYHRDHVPNFASLTASLYTLAHEHEKPIWEPEHEEAFLKTKEALSSTPCLMVAMVIHKPQETHQLLSVGWDWPIYNRFVLGR